MAVKMRLMRLGRRNRAFYRLVVADSRHPRDGRFIESLGHYDPLQDPAEVVINEEKVLKWLEEGAVMSATVRSLLSRKGVLTKWHESRFGGIKEMAEKATAEPKKKAATAKKTTKKTKKKKSDPEK